MIYWSLFITLIQCVHDLLISLLIALIHCDHDLLITIDCTNSVWSWFIDLVFDFSHFSVIMIYWSHYWLPSFSVIMIYLSWLITLIQCDHDLSICIDCSHSWWSWFVDLVINFSHSVWSLFIDHYWFLSFSVISAWHCTTTDPSAPRTQRMPIHARRAHATITPLRVCTTQHLVGACASTVNTTRRHDCVTRVPMDSIEQTERVCTMSTYARCALAMHLEHYSMLLVVKRSVRVFSNFWTNNYFDTCIMCTIITMCFTNSFCPLISTF